MYVSLSRSSCDTLPYAAYVFLPSANAAPRTNQMCTLPHDGQIMSHMLRAIGQQEKRRRSCARVPEKSVICTIVQECDAYGQNITDSRNSTETRDRDRHRDAQQEACTTGWICVVHSLWLPFMGDRDRSISERTTTTTQRNHHHHPSIRLSCSMQGTKKKGGV